jgi:Uma2 family endonuclease
MSPSFAHEDLKKLIARLVEAWAEERDVDLNGYGNVMLKRPEDKALERDECYCIGRVRETPDLAIEVVVISGHIDKLEIYRDLRVRELWVYRSGSLMVLRLAGPSLQTSFAQRGFCQIRIRYPASWRPTHGSRWLLCSIRK